MPKLVRDAVSGLVGARRERRETAEMEERSNMQKLKRSMTRDDLSTVEYVHTYQLHVCHLVYYMTYVIVYISI